MSELWKDSLKDIQEELKHLVREKLPIFSCVYIELSASCLEEMEIDSGNLNFWKDLEQKFTPSIYRAGHPLVNKFSPPDLCRHPESGRLFPRRKETHRLLQWYCTSNGAVTSPRPRNLPAISKLHENFQLLTDAAKLIPLELFQSILGKEVTPDPKPLDNWMNLLFTVAWQSKEGTRLRTRDIVYWPHREEFYEDGSEEGYEYDCQRWISLDAARELIIECRGNIKHGNEKSDPLKETDGSGRFFRKDLSNLFSIVKDVFRSSIHLINALLRQDIEVQSRGIDQYSPEEVRKIIAYAAKVTVEHHKLKPTINDIVKAVQEKYPPFRKDHFYNWGPDNEYQKELRAAINKAKEEKKMKLGGKNQIVKKKPLLSKSELQRLQRKFCKLDDISIENLKELLEAVDKETRSITPIENEVFKRYSDFIIKESKAKRSTKRKKAAKKP